MTIKQLSKMPITKRPGQTTIKQGGQASGPGGALAAGGKAAVGDGCGASVGEGKPAQGGGELEEAGHQPYRQLQRGGCTGWFFLKIVSSVLGS